MSRLKPVIVLLLAFFAVLFCSNFAFAQRIDSMAEILDSGYRLANENIVYTPIGKADIPQLTVLGAFTNFELPNYQVSIYNGRIQCKIEKVSEKSLTCTPIIANVKDSLSNINVFIKIGKNDPILISKTFSISIPTLHYISPLSVPITYNTKSNIHVSISGLPPTLDFVTISLVKTVGKKSVIPLDILSRQDTYLIVKVKGDFELSSKFAGFYDLDINVNGSLLAYYEGVISFFMPGDSYVDHISTNWLTTGGEYRTNRIIVSGGNLAQVDFIGINHPWANDEIFSEKTSISAQHDIIFDIRSFSFWNETIFPQFNATHYNSLTMYQGPIRCDFYSKDGDVIASSELIWLSPPRSIGDDDDDDGTATIARFLPAAAIPENYAAASSADKGVVISADINNFPRDVPLKITYGNNIWSLDLESAFLNQNNQNNEKNVIFDHVSNQKHTIGKFQLTKTGITFPLPQCTKCTLPHTAPICISPINSPEVCLINLGDFTYQPPQSNPLPTFSMTTPNFGFFENFSLEFNLSFFGVKLTPNENNIIENIVFQHTSVGVLLNATVIQINDHLARAVFPDHSCSVPGNCPEGKYAPVLVNNPAEHIPQNITVLNDAFFTLNFNKNETYQIGLVLDIPFDHNNEKNILDNIYTVFNQKWNERAENILMLNTAEFIRTEKSAINDDKNNQIELDRNKTKHTIAFFVIRPPINKDQSSSETFLKTIKDELNTPDSILYKKIPNLSISRVESHEYLDVRYCPSFKGYHHNCDKIEPKSKFPHVFIYIALFILLCVILAAGIYVIKTVRTKRKENNEDLLSDSNDYSQIV
jgi:hypothetical protein